MLSGGDRVPREQEVLDKTCSVKASFFKALSGSDGAQNKTETSKQLGWVGGGGVEGGGETDIICFLGQVKMPS